MQQQGRVRIATCTVLLQGPALLLDCRAAGLLSCCPGCLAWQPLGLTVELYAGWQLCVLHVGTNVEDFLEEVL